MNKRPRAFISYGRKDKKRVAPIRRRLETFGLDTWMDMQNLLPGQQWKPTIAKAIRESDFFIVFISENSVDKRGFFQREIGQALEVCQEKLHDDIFLIPVLLDDCPVPDRLADFQCVELFEEGGWANFKKALNEGMHCSKANTDLPLAPKPPNRTSKPKREAQPSEVKPVQNLKAVPGDDTPAPTPGGNRLPHVTFPHEIKKFLCHASPGMWESLDELSQRFVATLGTKLEPIVQIAPDTPVPLVIGFENLALGSLGENFSEICARVPQLPPGLLRLTITLAALMTTADLRINAAHEGNEGVWRLLFSINLDPEMLDCKELEPFLDRYQYFWEKNVIWEINEATTAKYLRKLKELQADRKLRYSADDFNNWNQEVKRALRDRIEMSKVDCKTFRQAMDMRGDDPKAAIEHIAAHRIADRPLIVEGVEKSNYLRFLREHWPFKKYGHLYGQGYIIEPGSPWDAWTADLRRFGLPGGHLLLSPQ